MNTPQKIVKKPFGLTIACKIAATALQQSIAPASVVISNLFALQKSTVFPQDLDVYYFANSRVVTNDTDRKSIVMLLDGMKKPQVNLFELLEKSVESDWVIKKAPHTNVKPGKPVAKAAAPKKKQAPKSKKAPVSTVAAPVVVVKKAKMSS